MPWIDRERLLAQHVRARLERRLRVLVVEPVRARDEADVHAGVDDVAVVLARDAEAPVAPDLLEQLGAFARDADELDVVPALREVRQVGGDGPGTGADDPESQLCHRQPSSEN